jgi:hypothetical protein
LIKKQFIQKFPELQPLLDTDHGTKKEFDDHVKSLIQECYKLDLVPRKKEDILQYNKN